MSKAPTLFDFDDFFPEEESKIKPVASKKQRPVTQQDVPEEKVKSPEPLAENPAETTVGVQLEPHPEPQHDLPKGRIEEQYVKPRLELPGKEALTDVLTGDGEGNLDKQYIEELASAVPFIASAYPFDPTSVEVIEKEKPAKQNQAIARSPATGIPEGPENEEADASKPLPEWNLDKNYYAIGEVAQLFGVNISHIRFWTTAFKMKTRTTRKGDRLYTPGQIAQLRLIYHLVKEKKHTLKGAMEILKSRKESVANHLDLKESLTRLRDILLEVRESL